MKDSCPACGGLGTVATDCPYCRDSEAYEHVDLAAKGSPCCGGRGYLEDPCPACGGTGTVGAYRRVS